MLVGALKNVQKNAMNPIRLRVPHFSLILGEVGTLTIDIVFPSVQHVQVPIRTAEHKRLPHHDG